MGIMFIKLFCYLVTIKARAWSKYFTIAWLLRPTWSEVNLLKYNWI